MEFEDRKIGDWTLSHFTIDPNNYRAIMRDGITPGTYVMLSHHKYCIMSNTPMERRTNLKFCQEAHGDVLIGGFGIGMIVMAIQDKPEVNSITIIEKHQEVIDMVAPQLQLNDKVKIIVDDVWNWRPERDVRYDCCYMDIWSGINKKIYEQEMKPLKRKYARFLKPKTESPNRFNKCWAEMEAKNGKSLM